MRIAELDKNDVKEVARMERELFSDSWSERSLEETLDNPQAMILGAWTEEKLVGYVICYYVLDEGEIARIAVDPSVRRQGVARRMFLELEDICACKGIARWMLDVRSSNEAAIACYHSLGFEEDGIRKNFYANPKEDAILMSREHGK